MKVYEGNVRYNIFVVCFCSRSWFLSECKQHKLLNAYGNPVVIKTTNVLQTIFRGRPDSSKTGVPPNKGVRQVGVPLEELCYLWILFQRSYVVEGIPVFVREQEPHVLALPYPGQRCVNTFKYEPELLLWVF